MGAGEIIERPTSSGALSYSTTPAGEGDLLEVAMGPHHPSTHGVFRMNVSLDGETVVKLKPVFGYLMDRIDARFAIWASLGGQLLGVLLLMRGGDFAALDTAAIIFGFSMGGVVPLHGALTARAFGRLSFGKAMGLPDDKAEETVAAMQDAF